mmetsp:Transcript_25287/g.66097  ORF Transcript_25287/g.66097 Transcript_25287/m.66097 type:complete len:393 (+) Transcript_25287:1005-2183(+)
MRDIVEALSSAMKSALHASQMRCSVHGTSSPGPPSRAGCERYSRCCEHSSQTTSPQARQWCFRVIKVNSWRHSVHSSQPSSARHAAGPTESTFSCAASSAISTNSTAMFGHRSTNGSGQNVCGGGAAAICVLSRASPRRANRPSPRARSMSARSKAIAGSSARRHAVALISPAASSKRSSARASRATNAVARSESASLCRVPDSSTWMAWLAKVAAASESSSCAKKSSASARHTDAAVAVATPSAGAINSSDSRSTTDSRCMSISSSFAGSYSPPHKCIAAMRKRARARISAGHGVARSPDSKSAVAAATHSRWLAPRHRRHPATTMRQAATHGAAAEGGAPDAAAASMASTPAPPTACPGISEVARATVAKWSACRNLPHSIRASARAAVA